MNDIRNPETETPFATLLEQYLPPTETSAPAQSGAPAPAHGAPRFPEAVAAPRGAGHPSPEAIEAYHQRFEAHHEAGHLIRGLGSGRRRDLIRQYLHQQPTERQPERLQALHDLAAGRLTASGGGELGRARRFARQLLGALDDHQARAQLWGETEARLRSIEATGDARLGAQLLLLALLRLRRDHPETAELLLAMAPAPGSRTHLLPSPLESVRSLAAAALVRTSPQTSASSAPQLLDSRLGERLLAHTGLSAGSLGYALSQEVRALR